MPKVTIVTVCFRNPHDLRSTLSSLTPLDPAIFERLVIDGSPDDSCERVSAAFPDVRHLRDADNGKYDAMNKGVLTALGDSLWFMNSGDVLVQADRLETAVRAHADQLPTTLVYGDVVYDVAGELLDVPAPEPTPDAVRKGILPSHQAILIPTGFHRAHLYDDRMNFAADTKLLRLAFASLPTIRLPFAIARFTYGGVSNSPGRWKAVAKQLREVREAHGLGMRETLSTAMLLVRRKILHAIFGEAWFRRVQRDRLLASGRAKIADDASVSPPCPPAV